MTTTTNSTSTTKFHHIDAGYNYNSSIIVNANEPLKNRCGPSKFKYYPILSSCHLMCEIYCDKCFAMKGGEITAKEWYLHIHSDRHNYSCINKKCGLSFVQKKHLNKHLPICNASQLLLANRKERECKINEKLINFPAESFRNKSVQRKRMEKIWITCYPDSSYCCTKLGGPDTKRSRFDIPQCTDPTYLDPKNNPPIPMNKCYFSHFNQTNTYKDIGYNDDDTFEDTVNSIKKQRNMHYIKNENGEQIKQFTHKRSINDVWNNYESPSKRQKTESVNAMIDQQISQDVSVMDEVIIKQEIISEVVNILPLLKNVDNTESKVNDNEDVIVSSISITNRTNNDLNTIDLVQADDIGVLIKFCPKCKVQANRTQKDIDNSCSLMTCRSCIDWTYWCWDCSQIRTDVLEDSNHQHIQCPHCRKVSRVKRNCKKRF